VSFIRLPGLKVTAGGEKIKAGLLGSNSQFDKLRRRKLFVGEHEADHFIVERRDSFF
jgi:hypothetical protein